MNSARAVFLATVLWAANLTAAPATNGAPRDQLLFRNGDFIFGKLGGISADEILQWQHPDAASPMQFSLSAVEEIDLAAGKKPQTNAGSCKVLFANGDLLHGALVGCDATDVTLDVPTAGRLKLPRARLQSLAVMPTEPAIVDGITGLDGWTEVSSPVGAGAESGHWTYRNGAFYASRPASIARNVKLPDMARIEFDLAWRGQPSLAIALYTDSLQPILLLNKENGPDFGAFYSFRLNGFVADMFPIRKHGQIPSLGSVILAALGRTDHAHFDLRVSKPQNRIILLIDRVPIMQWTDPSGFEGEGGGIRFVENSGALKLSNLRIARWDGLVEEKADPATNAVEDVVWLQNGKSISGAVASATGQAVELRVRGALQTLPFSTVREIDFATPAARPPAETAGVRATFAEGGSVHAQIESWTPEAAVLRSADFGRARFDPASFAALHFLRDEGN